MSCASPSPALADEGFRPIVVERRASSTPFGAAFSRNGGRSVGIGTLIAGFRWRVYSRLLRRYAIIFRFCDISRVCSQENFPFVFCAAFGREPSERLSATRLRSR